MDEPVVRVLADENLMAVGVTSGIRAAGCVLERHLLVRPQARSRAL